MATNINAQICVRRDTATNWAGANPILLNGEVGYDTTNNKIKIGNGSSLWNALPYLTDATGGGGGTDITAYGTTTYWATDFFGSYPNDPGVVNAAQNWSWYPVASSVYDAYVDYGGVSYPNHPGVITINIYDGSTNSLSVGMTTYYREMTNTRISAMNVETACVLAQVYPEFGNAQLNTGLIYDSSSISYGGSTHYGYYFRGQPSVNSGKWQCVYRVLNTSTGTPAEYTIDSGVSLPGNVLTTGAWANLKVTYTQGTVGAPEPTVRWYINGTLVATKDMNTLPANRAVYDGGGYASYATDLIVKVPFDSGSPGIVLCDYMHFIGTLSRENDPGTSISIEE